MDATCANPNDVKFICSANFLGFLFGVFFFPLPDAIGRKKTMILMLIPYMVTNAMVAYGDTIFIKTLGMFMQGVLHIRITLSYTHMYELIQEMDKSFCAQIINMADTLAMAFTGIILMLVTRDAVAYIQIVYIITTIGALIYLLLIPESPRWLITHGKHKEGIDALNWIAKVNGSKNRIP